MNGQGSAHFQTLCAAEGNLTLCLAYCFTNVFDPLFYIGRKAQATGKISVKNRSLCLPRWNLPPCGTGSDFIIRLYAGLQEYGQGDFFTLCRNLKKC